MTTETQTATQTATQQTNSLIKKNSLLLIINGRIDQSEFYQDNSTYYTVLTIPAKDEFSKPSTVKITSKKALGANESIIKIKVELNCYVNHYKYTDKKTGVINEGSKNNVSFTHVE